MMFCDLDAVRKAFKTTGVRRKRTKDLICLDISSIPNDNLERATETSSLSSESEASFEAGGCCLLPEAEGWYESPARTAVA